ncbi:MAG: hypothetical protein AABW92_04335, partial [Nanoarchaeota archaeon]
MKKETSILPIIFISFILLFFVFLMISIREPEIVANVVYKSVPTTHDARGGQVTYLNISNNIYSYWKGFIGNLTSGGNKSFDIGEQVVEIVEMNLGLTQCYNTELYVTDSDYHLNLTSNPTLPTAAYLNTLQAETNETHFEEYFNLTGLPEIFNVIKLSKIANETRVFEVGNFNLTTYGTTLNSNSGTYNMGFLKDRENNIIFVFRLADGVSYDGKSIDYEMMLPVSPLRNMTYYVFQDPTDDCSFPSDTPPTEVPPTSGGGGGGGGSSGGGGGGGGGYIPSPKCGDNICAGAEDCSICPIDCGTCPYTEQPGVVKQPFEEIIADESYAMCSISFTDVFLNANPTCKEKLGSLVDQSKESFKNNEYAEAILLSKSIFKICLNEAKVEAPAVLFNFSWLLLLLPLLIGSYVLGYVQKKKKKLEIYKLEYDKQNNIFEVTILKDWNEKVFIYINIVNVIVEGKRTTINFNGEMSERVTEELFKVPAKLKDADILANKKLKLELNYGTPKDDKIKVMRKEFDFVIKGLKEKIQASKSQKTIVKPAENRGKPETLEEYVKRMLEKGYNKEFIKNALTQYGWSEEKVDNVMKKFRSDPKEDKFKVLKEYILRQRDRGFAMEDIKKA